MKLNYFIVESIDRSQFFAYREIRDRYVDTAAPPVATVIRVSGLFLPGIPGRDRRDRGDLKAVRDRVDFVRRLTRTGMRNTVRHASRFLAMAAVPLAAAPRRRSGIGRGNPSFRGRGEEILHFAAERFRLRSVTPPWVCSRVVPR